MIASGCHVQNCIWREGQRVAVQAQKQNYFRKASLGPYSFFNSSFVSAQEKWTTFHWIAF